MITDNNFLYLILCFVCSVYSSYSYSVVKNTNSNVMKSLLRLQRWPPVFLVFMIVLFGVLITWLKLTCVKTTIVSVVYDKDKLPVYPPTSTDMYGAHSFRWPNHVITEYDDNIATRLETVVKRRSTAADPDLIRLIVDMLDPPSLHMVKLSRPVYNTPQSAEVDKILGKKVNTRK